MNKNHFKGIPSLKEEENETKDRVRELISGAFRIRQLRNSLSSMRKDIYMTDIQIQSPRIKIEFEAAYELPTWDSRMPWALISPNEDMGFLFTAWMGQIPFREERFETPEEVSDILDSLLKSNACPGLSEDVLLENVDKLQIADIFLFYSEPSETPIYRSRQCRYFLCGNEELRCAPCSALFHRIQPEHFDVKPDIHLHFSDDEDDFNHEDFYIEEIDWTEDEFVSSSPKKRPKKREWDCKQCEQSFKNERSLKIHECTEISEPNASYHYLCSECTIQFRFGTSYIDHLFYVHRRDPNNSELFFNEEQKLKCPYCVNEYGEPKDLEKHRASSHAGEGQAEAIIFREDENQAKFECFDCGKLFKLYRSYFRHRRRIHQSDIVIPCPGDPNRIIDKRCYFCPRHFTRRGKLARHLHESHSDKDLSQIEEVQAHNPKELRVCDICGKAVRNMSNHKENAHSDGTILKACHICGKLVKKISYRGHLVTHKQKSWLCSNCGQGFSHKTYLERHARIHDPEYKCLPCKFCNKLFGRMDSLNKHLKSAHLDQRDYICSTCGKAFVCKSKLNRHNVVHLNQKNYPCEACSYQCSRLDNLNAHRFKSHGLEKTTTAAVKERLDILSKSDVKLQASTSLI
ncbi:uncharacterized protein [Lepeophtheirus salmonis]|uniref:uncharacterized protein isoform X2 n=1 Tax=Lepeophtheirus salmonis TaxID=72036 RepID=UPI001AE85A92|nr:zinc finger protein 43-like isoform X2 [Lepeophtheirus salmonis]